MTGTAPSTPLRLNQRTTHEEEPAPGNEHRVDAPGAVPSDYEKPSPSRISRSGRAAALASIRVRATSHLEETHWPAQLAADLDAFNADWRESAEVCADVAWAARASGNSVLDRVAPEQVTTGDHHSRATRSYRHLYFNALRYDFRCHTLQALIERLPPTASTGLDCYSRALHAFALLGQSDPGGIILMDEVLDQAKDHIKTLHVLLHGLWLGHNLHGRAERILRLAARPPFAGRTDPIVLFREASALRQLGRYSDGLAVIDRALDLLPPGDTSVHADLVRERSLIAAASDTYRHARGGDETPNGLRQP